MLERWIGLVSCLASVAMPGAFHRHRCSFPSFEISFTAVGIKSERLKEHWHVDMRKKRTCLLPGETGKEMNVLGNNKLGKKFICEEENLCGTSFEGFYLVVFASC